TAPEPRERPTEAPTNYNVYRSNSPGGPWLSPMATPALQEYTDLSVIDGNTYYYVVTAQYAGGESGPSNQVSATPSSTGGDTTGPEILINADLADTTLPLSYWPISPGAKFAERLELDRPAKVKSLLFYALNIGAGQFVPGIHYWTGERIEGNLLPEIPHSATGTTLVVVDVDDYDIYVNSDFVVSFGIYDSTSFILSQTMPSDDHDWMDIGFGWFMPDSSRFIIGAEIEYVDSTDRYNLDGYVNVSGGTGGSPPPSDLSGSIVRVEGTDICDTTNVDGYYEIEDLEPGTYIVSANRTWFESQSVLVSLNADKSQDFNLIPYNLPVNPPRILRAESFHDGEVPLHWQSPMGSPGTAEWHTYWEYPESLFYYRPHLAPNSVECTRFDLWAPCTLTTARICFYDSAGIYDDVEFHIWGDDGAGFPDFSDDLISPLTISPTPFSATSGLQWTYVNMESLGCPLQLLPGDQIHIGIKHITSHPSVIFDETTPLETPTRSKIFDASISNWDADIADFLLEVYAEYFDIGSRPSGPRPGPEPAEIRFVDKDASCIPSATSPRMRPMTGIAVEFYDIYRTTDLDDTTSFSLIATVPGDSTDWVDETVANDTWNAYYIKTHQSHGISERSNYALAYPKTPVDTAHVLLVDDDGSSWGGGINEGWAYIDALDSLGIAFNGIDLNDPRAEGPTAAEMFDYDAVIWFTGMLYSDSTTLMDSDESNIETYLTAGGNFALFSQDYLWDRYNSGVSPSDFPARTFGLDSVQQDVCTISNEDIASLRGDVGGVFTGMNLSVSSPFGSFSLAPDALFGPNEMAELSFGPFHGPVVCGKSSLDSKTLLSSVPLSAIYDTTDPNNKTEFVRRMLLDYFGIFGPANVNITYNLSPGWNLVSLPIEPPDNSVSAIFPGHLSNVYFYDNAVGDYAVADSVIPGWGYWVLYTHDTSFTHSGPPVVSYDLGLGAGWNMVGSVMADSTVPFANATFTPDAFLAGNFYEYNGSAYVNATGFDPGRGYWVLVSAACDMSLDAGARRREEPNPSALTIDVLGSTLRAGVGNSIGYIPPTPPFGEGQPRAYLLQSGERCLSVFNETGSFELYLSEKGTMRFDAGEDTYRMDGNGRSYILRGIGEFSLEAGLYKLALDVLPSEFALRGALPNPFNATTRIEFDVPTEADVQIKIFDLQGRLVKKLVDGEVQAGVHSVVWDGRTDSGSEAASGVYFYKMSAGNSFNQSKRMMLIK
ncbi:T9SS type A sorting domain-containing protein, partial [bacterium]|nr:T9SS type A sorting domain-containing protein [bacterium]